MPKRLLQPEKRSSGSISSVPNLCSALDITAGELEAALAIPLAERYVTKAIPKADGSLRLVNNPDYRLRRIQRRINKRLLVPQSAIAWPDHIFGSIPNQIDEENNLLRKDYVACARVHCPAKSVLSIDVMNFFENVHQSRVEEIFVKFLHYAPDVAKILATLCCHNGGLIQGALTSSYLANLALYDLEGRVVDRLIKKGLRYTRLVDDITVSSPIADYNFDYARGLVEGMLSDADLPINNKKTKIQYISTAALTVHGLRVAFDAPRLPSDEVRRIRAAVQNMEVLAREDQYRTSHAYRHDFNRCMGRVNKLSRVGHKQHSSLVARLKKILPLPSKKDIERAIKIVSRLESDAPTKRNTYWYAKRYYLAQERLNVLQRSFPATAKDLRQRLKPIRTQYE